MLVYRRALHPTWQFRWRPQKITILDGMGFLFSHFLVGKRLDCLIFAAECGWGLIKQDVDRFFATWTPLLYLESFFESPRWFASKKNVPNFMGASLMLDRLGWQGTAMIMDEEASLLKRSWCLFELLQTVRWGRIRNWNTERRWEMYGKCLKEF